MEDKSLVWLMQGGCGNIIMRTALLPELKEKYGDEIYIIDPYADIFEVNDVNSYPQAPNSLYSQLIKDNDDCDVVAENPYNNSDFIKKGNIHFLDAVRDTLGLPRKGVEECMKENPILPVAEKHPEVLEDVKKYLDSQRKHKFILVQNTGGQSALDANAQPVGAAPLIRNYKWMNELVTKLKELYPDHIIIQYGLPQEITLDSADDKPQKPYLWFRVLGEELAKNKDNFAVVIDSSLQHMLAGTGLNTTVLWGETEPRHFGHSCHHNIDFVKNDIRGEQPYFQAWLNTPSVIRYKKPEEIINDIKDWLPKSKKEEK